MAYLVKPELSELNYRRKLHESALTMSDLRGAEAFPKEEWSTFYNRYIEADPKEFLYRYIFCPSCNDFVGEVQWKYDAESSAMKSRSLLNIHCAWKNMGARGLLCLRKKPKNMASMLCMHVQTERILRSVFLNI